MRLNAYGHPVLWTNYLRVLTPEVNVSPVNPISSCLHNARANRTGGSLCLRVWRFPASSE